MSFAAVADLLHDVLPVESCANSETIRAHVFETAERLEAELGPEHADYPEMMALAFVTRPLTGKAKIFALRKREPDFSALVNPTTLGEVEVGEILHDFCDSINDDANEEAYRIQWRV